MLKSICCFIICLSYLHVSAQFPLNQKAGELSYSLENATTSDGVDSSYYHIILKMVVDCSAGIGANTLIINDYESNTSQGYSWEFDSASNKVAVIDPCIAFNQPPCYRIFYYHINVNLPWNNGGYSLFYVDCCRDYYQNMTTDFNASVYEEPKLGFGWSPLDPARPGSGFIYNTIAYYYNIPSRFVIKENSSPVFDNSNDTVLNVCTNTEFSHTFNATDKDGDSLVYTFSAAKVVLALGRAQSIAIQTLGSVKTAMYNNPTYTDTQPLGASVTIDPQTGFVHGLLQDTGSYLLTVGVYEYRKGKLITTTPHTRDVLVKAFDCSKVPTPKAIIPPLINNCNAYTVTLPDNSTPYHSNIYWDNVIYLWDLGDGDTSQMRYPVHTYDTGTYAIRLITMPGYRCADTAYSKLLVYPSVKAKFTYNDSCTGTPVQFLNFSTTDMGRINSVLWTFTNTKDSAAYSTTVNNPRYTFAVPDQTYQAVLTVTTNKGCNASDTQYINIAQSPFALSTHDTVVTAGAPYQLHANAGYDSIGTFLWTPAIGLDNPSSANPIAIGNTDITYKVVMTNSYGCSLTDTVHLKYYKGPDIYVPSAFTPNGDGNNDIFRPFPVGIKQLQYFRVFNRWGNIVYQTSKYLEGWDGNIKGLPAPTGTYIWEIRGIDYKNKTELKKGTVLLVR